MDCTAAYFPAPPPSPSFWVHDRRIFRLSRSRFSSLEAIDVSETGLSVIFESRRHVSLVLSIVDTLWFFIPGFIPRLFKNVIVGKEQNESCTFSHLKVTMNVLESILPAGVQDNAAASSAVAVAIIFTVYSLSLGVYRLFLSPLAGFPGSRIAAATHYYEFYYDWWCQGKYIFEIERMHKIHGL